MARKKAPNRGKNLIRTDNYIINQHNVKISHEEHRQLKSLAARVNYKRRKMLKEFADQPLYYGKKRLDEDRLQLQLMGEEMDLMIRKRSAAVNQFKSKRAFNSYIKSLERAAAFDYMEYRGKLYKRNYITAIKNQYPEFPGLTKGIIMKVQMMKQEDFQKLVGDDRLFQIKVHYTLNGKLTRLRALREKLGLRMDDMEDPDEYGL